jgi:hypothetical protein
VAFATSARNALPFMEIGGEKTIWADVVQKIEGHLDARAEREWAMPASIVVQPLSLEVPATPGPTLAPAKTKRDALVAKIQAAAGPNIPSGPTGGKLSDFVKRVLE